MDPFRTSCPSCCHLEGLGLRTTDKVHTLALVTCARLIRRNVVVQFCLLLVDLGLNIISLGLLNLESEYLQLELEDLVLNLAIPGVSNRGSCTKFLWGSKQCPVFLYLPNLQSLSVIRVFPDLIDGIVESTTACLCILGSLSSCLEDG